MRSLIFVILLSCLLAFVVSVPNPVVGYGEAVHCGDVYFSAEQVKAAAIRACIARKKFLKFQKSLTIASLRKVNGIAYSCGNVLKKLCPSHLDVFPSPYRGTFFNPNNGPYITWHMIKLHNRILQNAGKYRVVAKFDDKTCLPAGVIVIERGKLAYKCQVMSKESGHSDMDSQDLSSKSLGYRASTILHSSHTHPDRSPGGSSTSHQALPRIASPDFSEQMWFSPTRDFIASPLSDYSCESPETYTASSSPFDQDNARNSLEMSNEPTIFYGSPDHRLSQGYEKNVGSPSRLIKKPSRHYNSKSLDLQDFHTSDLTEKDNDAQPINLNNLNNLNPFFCDGNHLPTIKETSEFE